MKNLLLFFAFLPFTTITFSQINEFGAKAPLSPNASSLGKYIEIPVNLYTGIPNINIPVINLPTKKLKLDVSLSYHASGIRVGEDASSVGLGWTLNAGGVINRIVRGETDSKTRTPIIAIDNFTWQYVDNVSQTKMYDNQPDLYYYNFDGMTGKFFVADDGTVVCNDNNNLKISLITDQANNIVQFKITSSNGTTYLFGENDNVDYSLNQIFTPDNVNYGLPVEGLINSYPTAYFLTTIRSIDNLDSIRLTYDRENNAYYTNDSHKQDYSISGQPNGNPSYTYSRIWINSRRLKSVISTDWSVEFEYLLNREDLNPYNTEIPKSLSQVIVKDYQGSVKKRIKFYTSYFNSAGIESAAQADKFKYKRLRLDSLQIFSSDLLEKLPPYIFKYDNVVLPNKNSTAQDYWGFYNGKVNNPIAMLPNIQNFYFLPVGANDPVIININGGSDRNPDANYMKACSLNEIKFPTGGIHKYTLEPNIYSKEVHSINNTSSVFSTGIVGYETSETIFQRTVSFETPANSELVDILFEFRRAKNYTSSHGEININGTTGTTIDLDNENVNYYSQRFPVSSIHPGANAINIKAFHGQSTITFVLRSNSASYVNTMAGGLRIKQIQIAENSTTKLHNYSYNTHDPNTLQISNTSSGVLITEPLFVSTYMRKVSETLKQQFLTVSPSPLIDLGTTQGGYVGYSEVEITENNGDNGSRIYYYSVKDFPDAKIAQYGGFDEAIRTLELNDLDHHEYIKLTNGQKLKEPFTPLSSNDYKRGQPKKSLFLNKQRIPVSMEEFNYGHNTDTITGVKYIRRIERVYQMGMWFDKVVRIDFNIYKEVLGNSNLINRIETTYGTNNIPIVKEYNFVYTQNPILLKESTELHGQKNIKTVYKYISDYDGIENFITLKSNNQYALPIKIEKIVNGNQVDGSIMKYNNSGLLVALFKYFSTSLQPPANHNPTILLPVTYSKYFTTQFDQYNNIVEQYKEYDLKESLLWDYNKFYQTAKIKNASQSDIAYTSFEADGKGNWTYTGTPTTDATAPTGKQVYTLGTSIIKSGLSATSTYIVSYWRKGGTIIINGTMPTPITGNTINGWTYCEHRVINPPGGTIDISIEHGAIDELRLYPATAQMTTYTYEPLIGMTSQCDANNKITYYEYDSFGRLKTIRDQDRNVIKTIDYQYQKPNNQ